MLISKHVTLPHKFTITKYAKYIISLFYFDRRQMDSNVNFIFRFVRKSVGTIFIWTRIIPIFQKKLWQSNMPNKTPEHYVFSNWGDLSILLSPILSILLYNVGCTIWTLLLHDIFVLVKNVQYVFSKDTKGRCPEFAMSIFYGGTYCNLKLERQRVNPAVAGNKFQQLAVKAREKASSAEIAHSVQPAQLRFLICGGVSSNTCGLQIF